jgi:hypothetical protein
MHKNLMIIGLVLIVIGLVMLIYWQREFVQLQPLNCPQFRNHFAYSSFITADSGRF